MRGADWAGALGRLPESGRPSFSGLQPFDLGGGTVEFKFSGSQAPMDNRRKIADSDPVDSNDIVAADVFCVRCGTNLRGGSVHDPCAACYHPISDSVWGDYLIYSHPAEIKRLVDAATLVIYGASLTAGIVGLALLATLLGVRSFVDGVERSFDMMLAGAMISPVIAGTGVALLTRRHSAAYYRSKFSTFRRLWKHLASVVAIAIACGVTAYFYGWIVQSCLLIAWAAAPAAVFFRGLSRLMHGMPNKKLGAFASALFVCTCLLAVTSLTVRLARPHVVDSADWQGPILALTFVTVLGAGAVGAFGFRLLILARRAIRAAG